MSFIQDFITSALVIDDSKEEVEKLIELLEEKDVWIKHYTPGDLEQRVTPLKNRRLIFLDLYLDDSREAVDNIALIRKYFKIIIGSGFGAYGIVLWTKHATHFKEFYNKIYNEMNPFVKPLFAVPLDKTKYIREGSYEDVLSDLEKILEIDVASSFFIEWNKAVKKGSDNTITNLYGLFETNEKKDKYLETVLFDLACNFTGIQRESIDDYDLQKDLVKSLMDNLLVEISNNYNNVNSLFTEPTKLNYDDAKNERTKVFSKLNSLLLLDFNNLSDKIVLPGNIYDNIAKEPLLCINSVSYRENGQIKTIDLINNPEEINVNKHIVLEITPPCDFAQNKKQSMSRVIGGIMLDYKKSIKNYFASDNFYSYLYPVDIEGYQNPQMIIFDFYKFQTVKEDELKDDSKYKVFAKAKDKLFADILQKLSSHTARLGIAIMNLNI